MRIFEQQGNGSRLYLDGGALYTHVDASGRNLLDYISAIERVIRRCDNVLLLGTAGGALATELSRRGAAVTAVDNWATAFEIARRWFHLPAEVECIHADAVEFLSSNKRCWSAVVVDVFRGVEIPDCVLTSEIGSLLRRAVSPGGLIVWNVADGPDSASVKWIRNALAAAGLTSRAVSVLDPDVGNTLVVASSQGPRRFA